MHKHAHTHTHRWTHEQNEYREPQQNSANCRGGRGESRATQMILGVVKPSGWGRALGVLYGASN